MNRVSFHFDPEESERAFIILTANGVEPLFDRRGAGGDVITVPEDKAEMTRRLINLHLG